MIRTICFWTGIGLVGAMLVAGVVGGLIAAANGDYGGLAPLIGLTIAGLIIYGAGSS